MDYFDHVSCLRQSHYFKITTENSVGQTRKLWSYLHHRTLRAVQSCQHRLLSREIRTTCVETQSILEDTCATNVTIRLINRKMLVDEKENIIIVYNYSGLFKSDAAILSGL